MDLAEAHQEIVDELDYTLEQAVLADCVAEVGEEYDVLVERFQALGLCHLQEFADVDKFRINLVRAGQARRYFLRRCRIEGVTTLRYLAVSRNTGFLAALAAGVLSVAKDIAVESTRVWNANWEYEDDFAFFGLLHTLASSPDPHPRADLLVSLDQFERALAGDRSTRFDLAKAIVDRDAKAFDTAMQAFVAEELRTRADEKKSAGHGREDASVLWARAEISVEGLAFLKAGELCSLAVTSELPLCPKLARLPWTGVTFPDLFEELAQADTEPA